MTPKSPPDPRRARMKAIFAACRAQGIDEDTRHALIQGLTGQPSLAALDIAGLSKVLDHLNQSKKGFAGRRRSTPSTDRAPLLAKIDALLTQLHLETGQVHTLAYADAICRRFGPTTVDFADARTLTKVVGALSRTLAFVRARTAKEATCA
jgi:hypothetical protein